MEPSPSPWHYAEYIYGLRHCLLDRDGRVIASHFPQGNGPATAAAPAMTSLLRELVADDERDLSGLRLDAAGPEADPEHGQRARHYRTTGHQQRAAAYAADQDI